MCDRSRGNLWKFTKEVIFTKNIDWNKSVVKFRSLRSFLDRVNVKKFNFLRIFKFMLSSAEIWGQRCTFLDAAENQVYQISKYLTIWNKSGSIYVHLYGLFVHRLASHLCDFLHHLNKFIELIKLRPKIKRLFGMELHKYGSANKTLILHKNFIFIFIVWA